MRLPVDWLKKYVDFKGSAEKLAEVLTMSGTAVSHIEKKDGGLVLHIEVTTNRPDCLSLLGLAQEVSALTGKKIKLPKIQSEKKSSTAKTSKSPSPRIEVQDKKGCPKYTARLITGVTIGPAPSDVQRNLELCGARPINNVVDATNFVLFEMGQPLHAFDFDKIKGGVVIVRRAKNGEKFLGIDGVEYLLEADTLVIADAEKPIAIAGVIGGKLTEVTSETKNILLESAFFDPVTVRRACRRYKVFTESSYRFEREVDIEKVASASVRARDLITEWAKGQETATFMDHDYSKKFKEGSILLRPDLVEALLGVRIAPARIKAILSHLGFKVKPSSRGRLAVATRNARRDVAQEADLVEELLRIEGFEKVPSVLPVTRHSENNVQDKKAVQNLELKKFLANLGFNEIITYSFLSARALANSGFEGMTGAQRIKNPVSAEHEFLRPTLLPGMLQTILFNLYRKAESLKFFEIGNRYLNGREETVLALSLYGHLGDSWQGKTEASFFDLKGVVENTLSFLKLKTYEWGAPVGLEPYEVSSSLAASGRPLGSMGILKQEVLKKWDIPRDVFFAEIVLEELYRESVPVVRVKAVPKFPSVRRDIAFVLDEKIPVKALENLMKSTASPFLQEARLFDQYSGKNISAGKRSLAFSLAYQKETGTFTDEEITALQSRVGEALKKEYGVEFR